MNKFIRLRIYMHVAHFIHKHPGALFIVILAVASFNMRWSLYIFVLNFFFVWYSHVDSLAFDGPQFADSISDANIGVDEVQ